MPSYTKFLKVILFNKLKLQEHAMVSLMEEYNTILQNKIPPKLEDSGSFSIPCSVEDVTISRTLYDLGATITLMPYSICKQFQARELKPTTISIQLGDHSVKYRIGMLEDVPLQFEFFFYHLLLCRNGDGEGCPNTNHTWTTFLSYGGRYD